VKNYISEYATSAPWGWMILGCMLLLGVSYWFLAFGIIKFFHHSNAAALGAIALSISGALLFLTALYPTWTVGATKAQELKSWERIKMAVALIISKDSLNAEIERAHRDKVAAIHDQMIQTSIACLVVAQAALAWALWREGDRRRLTLLTVALATLGVTAFALSKGSPQTAGLWQRIGFVFIIAWMLWVGRRFVAHPKREIARP
jgi:hypothetical protein